MNDMKKLIIIVLTLASLTAFGQTTYQLNYDSIRVGKTAGTGSNGLYGSVYLKNTTTGLSTDSILVWRHGKVFRVLNTSPSVALSATSPIFYNSGTGVISSLSSSANVANALVQRDGSGDFIANNISAEGYIQALAGKNIFNYNSTNANYFGTRNNSGVLTWSYNGSDIASMSSTGAITALAFVKSGGVSTEFLKADGSVTTTIPNSSTTASSANVADAIVTRDGSGNFIAGTITANLTGNASTVTTNANLTGPITSVGNATSIGSQTGTGSVFVVQNTPTLTTPVIGAATGTSVALSSFGRFGGSTIATNFSANLGANTTIYITEQSATTVEMSMVNNAGNAVRNLHINAPGGNVLLGDANSEISSAGDIYAATLGINGVAGNVTSGETATTTYNVSNVASSSSQGTYWHRIGNIVCFSVDVTPTPSGAGSSRVDLSIPVPSNFSAVQQAYGVISPNVTTPTNYRLQSNSTDDRLILYFDAADANPITFTITGHYEIL